MNNHIYIYVKSKTFFLYRKKTINNHLAKHFILFSPKNSQLITVYFKDDKKKKFLFSLGGSAKTIEVYIPDPKRAEVKKDHIFSEVKSWVKAYCGFFIIC